MLAGTTSLLQPPTAPGSNLGREAPISQESFVAERKPYAYLCGTPKDHCSGTQGNVNAALGGTRKVHSSSENAFKCHKDYLIRIGYTVVDSRGLRAPDGSGIRVLTKPIRFGAKLRNGKEGTRNMSSTRSGKGIKGGCIVSS